MSGALKPRTRIQFRERHRRIHMRSELSTEPLSLLGSFVACLSSNVVDLRFRILLADVNSFI